MKKIIITIIFASIPFGSLAAENVNFKESRNIISVSGACSAKEVKIELYQVGKDTLIYNSGAICKDKKFEFTDNLLLWKSLGDGQYDFVIDGDRKNSKKIIIERPIEVTTDTASNSSVAAVQQKVSDQSEKSPELKFLGAFIVLQQSILDMRQWLSQTSYPKLVKQTIGLALDSLDVAVGKLSGMVMSSEGAQMEAEKPLQAVAASEIQTPNLEKEKIPDSAGITVQNDSSQAEVAMPKITDQVAQPDSAVIDTTSEALQVN